MKVTNLSDLETTELRSGASDEVAWVGGFFAYGGMDAEQSATIYFAVPPGGAKPIKAGDASPTVCELAVCKLPKLEVAGSTHVRRFY